MELEYEEAAFELEVGECSGIVETESGFYLIEKQEKSTTYMLSNLESYADQITYAIVNNMVREHQATLSLSLNDFGKSLVLSKIPTTKADDNQ